MKVKKEMIGFICDEPKIHRKTCLLFAISMLMAHAIESTSNDVVSDEWEPSNWYQAEVIIFLQTVGQNDEMPPKDYQLTYPSRWIKLIDADRPIDIGYLARVAEHDEQSSNPLGLVQIKNSYAIYEKQTDVSNKVPFEMQKEEINILETQAAKPIFELPYALLSPDNRNLNETAAGLARREPYQVLFHEAWRFPVTEVSNDDPWIIIQSGIPFRDRYQLEGSIRFYKSRFLHFETNLWLTEFASEDMETSYVTLPTFLGEVRTEQSLYIGSSVTNLTDQHLSNSKNKKQSDQPVLFSQDNGIASYTKIPNDTSASFSSSDPNHGLKSAYPVTELWIFNQTRRLRESEIHYLDHPEIGIILRIDAYKPLLLNPQEQPDPFNMDTRHDLYN